MALWIVVFSGDGDASSDFDLFFDQVVEHDFFGDGVFYLDACVHFNEVEVAVSVYEEFYGTHIFVLDGVDEAQGGVAHFFAEFGRHKWRRGFFNEFLVFALD